MSDMTEKEKKKYMIEAKKILRESELSSVRFVYKGVDRFELLSRKRMHTYN